MSEKDEVKNFYRKYDPENKTSKHYYCKDCDERINEFDARLNDGRCDDCDEIYTDKQVEKRGILGLEFLFGKETEEEKVTRKQGFYAVVDSIKEDTPEMGGQIWDECSKCGREPIYSPLELCERCWPKK